MTVNQCITTYGLTLKSGSIIINRSFLDYQLEVRIALNDISARRESIALALAILYSPLDTPSITKIAKAKVAGNCNVYFF